MKSLLLNDRFILLAIAANTILLFVGGFYMTPNIEVADDLFTLLFILEAITKIRHYGWKTYWTDSWNRFDLVLLLLAIPSILSLFMELDDSMKVLLSLRAFRVFKSFKTFRFIPNIQSILNGIKLAFNSSLFICLAFSVFLLVTAILTSSLFGKYASEYFGNPLISIYSIFRLFTVEGWYEMPEAIAANAGATVSMFARIYFCLVLFAGGIIGMSLINSIFVDAMMQDNNDEILKKLDNLERKIDQLSK